MESLFKGPRLLILILIVSLASVSAVLFTPALPLITDVFDVSETTAQWSMSIFLVGYSLGQLPYGPLSNRFGRKTSMVISLDIALVGSLICLFSNAFWLLCIGRFIQAIGSAGGTKIVFTMVSDQYKGNGAVKSFSYILMAFAIMPGLAMATGGFLTVYFGWRGCFGFLSLYSLLLSFLIRLLPETMHKKDKNALQLGKIVHGLGVQFKDSFLMMHAVMTGFGSAIIYVFATVAPYIAIDMMGLSPDVYGLWAFLPPLGLGIGILFIPKVTKKVLPRIGILSGILVSLLAVLVWGVFINAGLIIPATLFLPMVLVQVGISFSFTFSTSKGLGEVEDKSNANAVLQFTNMGIVAVITLITGLFLPLSIIALSAIIGFIVLLELALWLKLRAHHANFN
jgi:MFS family permease